MKNLEVFKPIVNLIKKDKFKIFIAAFLLFISSLSSTLTGYLNGAAVESISKLDLKRALIFLLIYLGLKLSFGGYFRILAFQILRNLENKISKILGYKTYAKALNLPAYAFEEKSSGEIINRITSDSDSLSSTFEYLLDTICYSIGVIIIFIYILFNSWIIGLEIIGFVLLMGCILKKYNPMLKKANKEKKEIQDKFSAITTESIRGIREIKTLGIKSNLLKNVEDIVKISFEKNKNEISIEKEFDMKNNIIRSLMEVTVFITGAILLYCKEINLTFFIAMTYYIYDYTWLLDNISYVSKTYQKLTVSLERVNEIIGNKLYKDEKFGKVVKQKINGVIEFKNVTFGYPNEEATLKNFNLKIDPNKKIAIVGKSGQGKSTFFNLLTRIFDVNNGQITIDGIDIKDFAEDNLRKHISIIRQDPFIFNRSIKENFKLINKNIKLSEIRKYTSLAYLDEYIMLLPKKYDTILGEGGVNLSGGQKQRLAIARSLAKNSKIILFDEATSALDNNSQNYIKKTIDNLVKDHTIIIVAHRLSTIIDADIIYVVDNGKIISSGTHQELLNSNKVYKKLYETETLNK